MVDHGVEGRFLNVENWGMVLARDSVQELLQAQEEWRPARAETWLDRKTR
jgi:hypothetical protein